MIVNFKSDYLCDLFREIECYIDEQHDYETVKNITVNNTEDSWEATVEIEDYDGPKDVDYDVRTQAEIRGEMNYIQRNLK